MKIVGIFYQIAISVSNWYKFTFTLCFILVTTSWEKIPIQGITAATMVTMAYHIQIL